MLELDNSMLLGRGSHRSCYQHPNDATKCIKVLHKTDPSAIRGVNKEMEYFRKLESYLVDWSGIPRFLGIVETSLGQGYVYERVADFDGKTSCTLLEEMAVCKTWNQAENIACWLRDLKHYLLENHIVLHPIHSYNILVCHETLDSTKLLVCDNYGQRVMFKFATWVPCVARHRLRCQWEIFKTDKSVAEFLARYPVDIG